MFEFLSNISLDIKPVIWPFFNPSWSDFILLIPKHLCVLDLKFKEYIIKKNLLDFKFKIDPLIQTRKPYINTIDKRNYHFNSTFIRIFTDLQQCRFLHSVDPSSNFQLVHSHFCGLRRTTKYISRRKEKKSW